MRCLPQNTVRRRIARRSPLDAPMNRFHHLLCSQGENRKRRQPGTTFMDRRSPPGTPRAQTLYKQNLSLLSGKPMSFRGIQELATRGVNIPQQGDSRWCLWAMRLIGVMSLSTPIGFIVQWDVTEAELAHPQ